MVHGNHWEAIIGEAEGSIESLIPVVVEHGNLTPGISFILTREDGTKAEETVVGAEYPDTPLRFMALISTDSAEPGGRRFLYSAYPYCFDGCPNQITVDSIDADSIEGIIEGSCEGGASISFFDPLFFLNGSRYEVGKTYSFSVAGLAYSLRRTAVDSIDVTEGPLIELEKQRVLNENPDADTTQVKSVRVSLEGACWLFPTKIADDAEFRGVIDSVGYFEVEGTGFYRIKMTLIRAEERPLDAYVYASEPILGGYTPKAGDSIEGFLWLQGRLISDTK